MNYEETKQVSFRVSLYLRHLLDKKIVEESSSLKTTYQCGIFYSLNF